MIQCDGECHQPTADTMTRSSASQSLRTTLYHILFFAWSQHPAVSSASTLLGMQACSLGVNNGVAHLYCRMAVKYMTSGIIPSCASDASLLTTNVLQLNMCI